MKWVFFDISYLAHRAFYSMGGLEHNDYPTGVIYGVLDQIRRVCLHPRIQSNCAVAFFDSNKSFRRDIFPEYKQKRDRERTQEELDLRLKLTEQIKHLRRDLLPSMGMACYQQSGLESDDLMAWGAKAATCDRGTTDTVVLVTADNDLLQCVTRRVQWFDPMRDLYLKYNDVCALKGVSPKQWALVKALAGCSSDGVPGVGGVGEKTSVAYLRGELPHNSKKYAKILAPESQEVLSRNTQLVSLPHKATAPFVLRKPIYSRAAFLNACMELGFTSFVDGVRSKEWDSFFRGRFGGVRMRVRRRGELRV
jgi:5'-3' exonuclease